MFYYGKSERNIQLKDIVLVTFEKCKIQNVFEILDQNLNFQNIDFEGGVSLGISPDLDFLIKGLLYFDD